MSNCRKCDHYLYYDGDCNWCAGYAAGFQAKHEVGYGEGYDQGYDAGIEVGLESLSDPQKPPEILELLLKFGITKQEGISPTRFCTECKKEIFNGKYCTRAPDCNLAAVIKKLREWKP